MQEHYFTIAVPIGGTLSIGTAEAATTRTVAPESAPQEIRHEVRCIPRSLPVGRSAAITRGLA